MVARAEIIFHVGRCEINNGQTRFDFPEVPVGRCIGQEPKEKRAQGPNTLAYNTRPSKNYFDDG
ncbi:hypothetical protein WH47_01368 [Habropoda laboriosa]|uniref:Uncharacterized protein n=1 Tax=Habropoda laboriosa TaxID=597456 RepID=A0A0L7R665_9HYME|nr:hypothetical protein WH47_01368 [Habropoda laboriosa]